MIEILAYNPDAGFVDARTPREILTRQVVPTDADMGAAVDRIGRALARLGYPAAKPVALYVREVPRS
jgi:hypothetical protein